ncbi:MAG: hypothetical protein ACRDQ6_20455, partial [Pseudonocardiaceae bacterium]
MEGGPLKLSPVPSELVARGWIFLALHVSGVLVALPSVQHRAVTLGLCAANGVLFGLLALA